MKAILLGTDFMYNKVGKIVPIQINTAVGHNHYDRVEDDEFIFDLNPLKDLILENNFSDIFYIGDMDSFKKKFSELCVELDKSLSYYKVGYPSLTIPSIKDNSETLIIRSAYDTTAIIDDTYCRNRGEFLNLIHETDFGSEFAYVNFDGKIINNIKTITKNGIHPNFILKSVYPDYDRDLYPKPLRIETKTELDILVSKLTPSFFLMPFYYNKENLFDMRIKNIRSLNILTMPNLESMPIGTYTKITKLQIPQSTTRDENFEIIQSQKMSYLTTDDMRLMSTDLKNQYINERIISTDDINEMNSIMTRIGNQILLKNS